MGNFNLSTIANKISSYISKHSPGILTGLGISGMATTTIIAVSVTPKSLRQIEEEKKRDQVDELSFFESAKIVWKNYIPAAATFAVSIVCLIGATSINNRRTAAFATAYSLSEATLREYRDKVVDTIGEKKEKEVRDSIAQDHVNSDPIQTNEIIVTGKGETRCYDTAFGGYFKSDMETIRKAVNKLNRDMIYNNYVSVNDFFYELGRQPIDQGEDLGWNVDEGLIDIGFSAVLSEDDEPCIALSYLVAPRRDFKNLH